MNALLAGPLNLMNALAFFWGNTVHVLGLHVLHTLWDFREEHTWGLLNPPD